ncbi:MAG: glutamine synthetase III [Sphaerochaetaceae bacterium]|nr:glutamine synthetase III [Sphaerochaetaceae bacterium]MDC7236354.1 glutamine synthetase III [Sphaerochaetaceae bacterium]
MSIEKISDYFGSQVFGDEAMRERLPKDVYFALKQTIRDGKDLDLNIANAVAHAMKQWALEKGATHYTHWFQPMTGITAEKHDSFITPTKDGKMILSFSGKELVKGEPDASSFPSGGLRATFEARGYTAWDPTSYAFVKDETLCIPTAFCSYSGAVLDKKTPLLRSMELLRKQALRIVKLFGHDETVNIIPTVGPEQEYFLIDKCLFEKRKDLKYTGRTLIGARPPKGQELDDHYFGNLRLRVSSYMQDLDKELWKLGIYAKTRHNEVSPAQHELAPVFTTTNIACDHNQITMEIMKKVADKHGLACLLHEKPFAGLNGSGKHNNFSLSTEKGINLLEPGDNPKDNAQFLLFLVAIIKAVDEYQDLLRVSVASCGNDHRLGANEAPPAIVSMFLGDELTSILEDISEGRIAVGVEKTSMVLGVHVLPDFPKDTTDRNRTSPLAFTGNKFEFRMLGSSMSVSDTNTIINTIIAKSLKEFADELEDVEDFDLSMRDLVKRTYKKHKRIVFNGNNYCDQWVQEAKKRGLLNLKSTVDAIPVFANEKNIKLFEDYGILSREEVVSRCDILFEQYEKIMNIEALTLIDMIRKQILPSCQEYMGELATSLNQTKSLIDDINITSSLKTVKSLAILIEKLNINVKELEISVESIKRKKESEKRARAFYEVIYPQMAKVREVSDELELIIPSNKWPIPVYGELLYSV